MNGLEDDVGQQRGHATRREIVAVARQLLSEHGYSSTGIADIQAATGLTKGAFYHHFSSKEDVALAAIEAARADYVALWAEPGLKKERPAKRLEACLDQIIELNNRPEWRNCKMLALLSAEAGVADVRLREAVADLRSRVVQRWEKLVTDAQQAGQVTKTINANVAAEWIMSTLMGVLLAQKLDVDASLMRQVIGAMKRVLIKDRKNR